MAWVAMMSTRVSNWSFSLPCFLLGAFLNISDQRLQKSNSLPSFRFGMVFEGGGRGVIVVAHGTIGWYCIVLNVYDVMSALWEGTAL